MEKKYGITERWTTVDHDYADAKAAHLKEKQQQLKSSMWAVVTRRVFIEDESKICCPSACKIVLYWSRISCYICLLRDTSAQLLGYLSTICMAKGNVDRGLAMQYLPPR